MYLCEYLPRLNSVSVLVDFQDDVTSIKQLKVENESLLILTPSQKSVVQLPLSSSMKLISIKKSNDLLLLSFSLTEKSNTDHSFMSLLDSQVWSCRDLLAKTPKNDENKNIFDFRCTNCGNVLIDSADYQKFSDMPSDLWAEMMDFWHCHKPNTFEKTKKDYNGNIKPQQNSVLIGNYYLLLDKESAPKATGDKVRCSCDTVIGEVTQDAMKIFKWNLVLNFEGHKETYPPYLYAYNLLLDKINSQACRKILINDYLIWVFNIGLKVCVEGQVLTNCLKILYCKVENDTTIYDDRIKIDDEHLFASFLNELGRINEILPPANRTIQINEDNELTTYSISYLGI